MSKGKALISLYLSLLFLYYMEQLQQMVYFRFFVDDPATPGQVERACGDPASPGRLYFPCARHTSHGHPWQAQSFADEFNSY